MNMEHTQIDPQNQQQVLAYELIANTNSSFFLTGRAGTGKTTFLRNVQKMVDKQFITLAPTGVAAILAGGDTIHSFFGLPMEVCTPGTCGKLNEARILTLLHADTIIIDEVSMVWMPSTTLFAEHFVRLSLSVGSKLSSWVICSSCHRL